MPPYRSHIHGQVAWLAALDVACLAAGCAIGSITRFAPEEWGDYVVSHMDGWLILISGVVVANYLAGGYRLQATYSRFNLVVTWLFSLIFATVILSVTSYGWFRLLLGRGVLFLSLASYSIVSLALKLFVYRALFRSEWFVCRCAIMGTGRRAREVRAILESKWVMPAHRVVAFLSEIRPEAQRAEPGGIMDGVPVLLFRAEETEELLRGLGVDLVVAGCEDSPDARASDANLRRLRFRGVEVLTAPAVVEIYCGRTPLDLVNEAYLTDIALISEGPGVAHWKRLADIVFSLLALAAFAPVSAVIALAIKLAEPGAPVLYVQERVGRFGQPFRIRKFRTMRQDAEADTGPVWAGPDDPRVTPLGRFLRRFRLDEIPQFLNVLVGEMSIVGPRPERPEIACELEKVIPYFRERENVMPGLTGWAQIRYPYGRTVEDAVRKLEYDLYYIKHMSLALDLQIVLSTLRIIFLGVPANGE